MNSKATIGNYDIGRTLGEGTFGKVKLGFHRIVQELVAVKILYKQRITEKADVQRITREIAILKAVNHSSVVRLFEIIETQDEIYLVMEYAQQGDLVDYIRRREKVPEREAAAILVQILNAVEYIHSIGVAHRDLKPSNILVSKENHIKLADFGLSNMYSEGCKLNSPCGSPCYAAPEVIEGKSYQPLLADIWSMGVVLFMMIAGHLPYQHKNTHSLYKLILSAKYEAPKGMSKLAGDLIGTIFKTNPSKRARIKDIRSHPWMQLHLGSQKQIPSSLPTNQLVMNDKILHIMAKAGHKIQEVLEEVKKNRHGSLSTLYHLYNLKNQQQLEDLVDTMERESAGTRPRKILTIDVRNPVDGSNSARKLLRRTTPRGSATSIRRSSSKDHTRTDAFRGAYQKMLKNESSSSITNPLVCTSLATSLTLNQSSSFYSKLPTTKTQSSSIQTSFRLQQRKKSLCDKLSSHITSNTSNPSTERRVSIDKGVKSRRFSFAKRIDPHDTIDTYNGPFGVDSVFQMDPVDLKLKIVNYARLHRINIKEMERWMVEVRVSEEDQATVIINRLYNAPKVMVLRVIADPNSSIPRKLLTFLNS